MQKKLYQSGPSDYAVHPGETLAELLEERAITTGQLSEMTGIPKTEIDAIVACENPGNASYVAPALERALGLPARLWGRLVETYERDVERLSATQADDSKS